MMRAWWKVHDPEEPLISGWLAGTMIGLLLTVAVAVYAPIGMSSEFAYTGGRLMSLFLPQVANTPYWQGKLGVDWVTTLVLGAFLGGALAAWLVRKPSLEVPSVWAERFGTERRKRYLLICSAWCRVECCLASALPWQDTAQAPAASRRRNAKRTRCLSCRAG